MTRPGRVRWSVVGKAASKLSPDAATIADDAARSARPGTRRGAGRIGDWTGLLGEFDDAWRCIGEAMTTAETTHERLWQAEICRMAGEIALLAPEPDAAT